MKGRSVTDELRIIRYVALLPQSPSPQPLVAPQEARSLQFFRLRTAPELGGPFSSEVWSSITLQAHHEKATFHAVVALSSLHEHYEKHDYSSGVALKFSMQQYGKAIREVVQLDVAKSVEATGVALRTCLLFASFESLQGHYTSALTHLNSGIRLLSGPTIGEKNAREPRGVYQAMAGLFRCMETQILEIGDGGDNYADYDGFLDTPIILPTRFSSLETAMTSSEIIRSAHLQYFEYYTRLVNIGAAEKFLITKRVQELTEAIEN
jgi:hypothetical protein